MTVVFGWFVNHSVVAVAHSILHMIDAKTEESVRTADGINTSATPSEHTSMMRDRQEQKPHFEDLVDPCCAHLAT